MASANIKIASDSAFEKEVINGGKPALVDFWATWCAPCRAIAPIIEDLANLYGNKINVFKLDIDQNPETPVKYGIRGVPTVILFKDGQIVDQIVGAVPKSEFEKLVQKVL